MRWQKRGSVTSSRSIVSALHLLCNAIPLDKIYEQTSVDSFTCCANPIVRFSHDCNHEIQDCNGYYSFEEYEEYSFQSSIASVEDILWFKIPQQDRKSCEYRSRKRAKPFQFFILRRGLSVMSNREDLFLTDS